MIVEFLSIEAIQFYYYFVFHFLLIAFILVEVQHKGVKWAV